MKDRESMDVVINEHDPSWHDEFLRVKELIHRIWEDNVLDIQHVGSTSISGICAKPILDIAVRLRDLSKMDIEKMEEHGYEYMGARNENSDRHLFIRYNQKQSFENIALQHIHCYSPASEDYWLQIGFRDYLNKHPEEAMKYDSIKRQLAQRFPNDRYAYSDGKREFIENVIHQIRKTGYCNETIKS